MAKDKIKIFADATCDLPIEFIKEHDIGIIGLRYNIGESDGWFETATDAQLKDFYTRMRKGESASTSLVLYDDAKEAFEPWFKDGYDIIHFGLSSGLAKTWENANNAGKDLAKQYGRQFYAPDTKCVSAMMMPLVEFTTKAWGDFDGICAAIDKFFPKIRAYFTVEDLKYLKKSGRLSGAAALIGGMLNIKPIITVDKNGKLTNMTKKTGRMASIAFLASQVTNIDPEYPTVYLIHADSAADIKVLEAKVREVFIGAQTCPLQMGFIISAHTGPGTLGLGFVAKD